MLSPATATNPMRIRIVFEEVHQTPRNTTRTVTVAKTGSVGP